MAADWRVALLKARGFPITKSNLQLLGTWQKFEGGGTHNDASFNPLNTTRNAPGAVRSINSVGVKAFDTFQNGINATASTLDNYKTISAYLKAGNGSAVLSDPDGVADFNKWVSGNASPVASDYTNRIAAALGQPVGNANVGKNGQSFGGGGNPTANSVAAGDAIGAQRKMLQGFLLERAKQRRLGVGQGNSSMLSLVQARKAMQDQIGPETDLMGGQQTSLEPTGKGGGYLDTSKGWSGTHVTDGLDWNSGQKSAADLMAAAGTSVGAPEAGMVVRHGSAQGGQAMYFKGASGKMYWLGHIDNMLPVGSKVAQGAVIATVSPDHARPHLHIDRKN